MDANHFAGWEKLGKNVERFAVIRIVEGRDENQTIRDVEVAITGWQTLAFKDHWRWHRQLDNTEWLACEVAGGLQTVEVFREWQVVVVCVVGLGDGDDSVLADKTGDVVDVAVGVVSGYATIHPEDLVDAEIIVEDFFELLAADARVALLDSAEQTFLSRDERACAVHVNGTAFEDYSMVSNHWLPLLQAQFFGDVVWNLVVKLPVVVFRPGIEFPIGDRERIVVFHEDGAGITGPHAVGWPLVEINVGDVRSRPLEDVAGAFGGCRVVDEDMDDLDVGEMADDVGVNPGNCLELARPIVCVVRPGNPGGGV